MLQSFSLIIFITLFCLQGISGENSEKQEFKKEFWNLFKTNSKIAMNQMPPKFDSKGRRIFPKPNLGKSREDLIQKKIDSRSHLIGFELLSGFDRNNTVQSFFPLNTPLDTNIDVIHSKKLESRKVSVAPWSGDYWPTYRGGLGSRYDANEFPEGADFNEYLKFYETQYYPIDFNNLKSVDALSASEKYDIILGDEDFSLTKWSWEQSKNARNERGEVETWFGLCHGWAPAAYMLPRPTKTIKVPIKNFQGKSFDLNLYPDDIKGLATLLWATTPSQEVYGIGGRCNEKNPTMDDHGRLTQSGCFDVNPGTWHIAITNQIGNLSRSFVMDATFDYEVWNQPVVSYNVRYFHPENKDEAENPNEVTMPIKDYLSDNFKKYRNPQTKYVVGVSMEVLYTVENSATHDLTNDENQDNTTSVIYLYDLELDEKGNIIGGEWYQNTHPDFLWTPEHTSRARSRAEDYIRSEWDGKSEVAIDIQKYGSYASKYGQPLSLIIEKLIELSRQQ